MLGTDGDYDTLADKSGGVVARVHGSVHHGELLPFQLVQSVGWRASEGCLAEAAQPRRRA